MSIIPISLLDCAEIAGWRLETWLSRPARQSRRLPYRSLRLPGAPNQGLQERAVGIEHAQVAEVATHGAAADLACGTDAGLPRGTPLESQRGDRSLVAVAEERRWLPRSRRTLRGPARLVAAVGDGSVLQHDLPTGIGCRRPTGKRPGERQCPGHSRGPAPRPAPYVRDNAADGWDSLHAGIKVAVTQHLYPHARHLRRLDPRGGRRRGQ